MDVDVFAASTIHDIEKLKLQLSDRENALVRTFENLSNRRSEIETSFAKLLLDFPDVREIESNASEIAATVKTASDMANEISSKVRKLDTVKGRVQQTYDRIDSILLVKECSEKLEPLIGSGQYEECAKLIERFICLDKDSLDLCMKVISEETGTSSNLSAQHEKLKNLVIEEFDKATRLGLEDHVLKYAALFPRIGLADAGLQRFSKYLIALAKERFRDKLDSLENKRPILDVAAHFDGAIVVLETFAGLTKQYKDFLQQNYPSGGIFSVIRNFDIECHANLHRILSLLQSYREWKQVAVSAKIALQSPAAIEQAAVDIPDRRQPSLDFNQLTDQLSKLTMRIALYIRFMRRHAAVGSKSQDVETYFTNSPLASELRRLSATYLQFEQAYLCDMLTKAATSEEVDADSKTYRFVDDVFFLLKKSICRVLSGGEAETIKAMLIFLIEAVHERVIAKVAPRVRAASVNWLRDACSASAAKLTALAVTTAPLSSKSGASQQQQVFLLTLNSLSVIKKNLQNLTTELRSDLSQASTGDGLLVALQDFENRLRTRLDGLLKKGFDDILATSVSEQIRTYLDPFELRERVLTESDLEEYAVNDPWANAFITKMGSLLRPFRAGLLPENYERFIALVVDQFVNAFEKAVTKKTFNRLGAIQLDREFRSIMTFFSTTGTWSVRDRLNRISQIVTILNVESLDEVPLCWESPSWSLPANDIRKILTQRTEFETSDIRKVLVS